MPYIVNKLSNHLVNLAFFSLDFRWFAHFYLFAIIYTLLITSVMFMTYWFNRDIPQMFEDYIHMVTYQSHEPLGTVSFY